MSTRCRRSAAAIAAGAALALGTAACGDDGDATSDRPADDAAATTEESVEQAQPVTGGETTLDVDQTALDVLGAIGVDIEAIGPAEEAGGTFSFPITGGSVDVDTPSGSIEHDGGLRFSAGGQSIDARDLVVEPGDGRLTAEIEGERLPLLAVDVDAVTVPESGSIVLPGEAAALSDDLIGELEERLGVDLPDTEVVLGELQVSAES